MIQYYPSHIPFRKGEKWGYTNKDKQILIDLKYDEASPFIGLVARVRVGSNYGLIDRDGNEVVPIICDEIGSIDGTLLNDDGSCTLYADGKFGLAAVNGKLLTEISFDSEEIALEHAQKSGWKGAVPYDLYPDISIERINKIEAGSSIHHGIFTYRQDGLWGLMNAKGEVIYPNRYDELASPENGYYPCMKNEKWGLLSSDGEEVITPQFDEIRGFSNGQAACRKNEYWGAVNEACQWMIDPIYEELGELKDGLVAAQKDGLFGFVDEIGKPKIAFQFQDVLDFSEGACIVFEDEQVYVIDTVGNPITEKHTRIFGPDKHMFIHVMKDDKWGILKSNGQFLLPIEYDLPRAMGQVIQVIEEDRVPIKKGALLGYADTSGKEIVSPKYVTVDAFKEGLSLVSIPHKRLSSTTPEMMESTGSISGIFQFGFINKNGNEVIPLKYTKAHRFQYGLAFVETEDTASGYITYDGTEYFED